MKKFLNSILVISVVAVGIFIIIEILNNKPPKPLITAEGKTVEVAQGSYCWSGLLRAQCVDMISPPELIKSNSLKPESISAGTKVKIEFNQKPNKNTLGVNRWSGNGQVEDVPLKNNMLKVPMEKGIYVYDVYAYWDKGSSSFAFVIEVK
jgi:hypothetical protein